MRGGFGNSRRSNITINNATPSTSNTQKSPDATNNFYLGGGTRDCNGLNMTTYPKRNNFGRGGSGVGVAEYSSGVVGRGSFRGAIFGGVETESRQQTRRSPASFTDHSKFSKSAVDQPPYCTDESYYTKRDYEIFVNDHHREPVRGGRPKFSNSTRCDFGRGGLPRSNVEPFTFFRKRPDLEESTKTSKAFAGQQRPYYEQVKKDVVKLEKTTMMAEVLSSRENEPALQDNKQISSSGGFGRGRRGPPQQHVVAKLNRNKELMDSFVPKNISDFDAMIYSKEDIQKISKDSEKGINYNMLFSPILADVKDPSSKDAFPILLNHFDVLTDGTLKLKRVFSRERVVVEEKEEKKNYTAETVSISVSLQKSLPRENAEVALKLKSLVENALDVDAENAAGKVMTEKLVENSVTIESATVESVGDVVADNVDPTGVGPVPNDEMDCMAEGVLNALPEKEEKISTESDFPKEQTVGLSLAQKSIEYMVKEFRLLLKQESDKQDKKKLKESKELIKENARLCERLKAMEEKNERLELRALQLEKKLKLVSDFCSSFLSKSLE